MIKFEKMEKKELGIDCFVFSCWGGGVGSKNLQEISSWILEGIIFFVPSLHFWDRF